MPSLSSIDFVLFAILIGSLSFHEAAHAWTANKLGDPTARLLGRLTLNPVKHIDLIGTIVFPLIAMYSNFPLIGWAKPVPVDMRNLRSPRRDFAVVALAGPVSNLILGVGVAAIVAVDILGPSRFLDQLLVRTIVTNVVLAVFNLIPVPPLDGGNVLAGLVPESFAQALDGLRQWGFILLYVLMFAGVLGSVVVPVARVILSVLGIYL